ncbi:MAG: hypothetical protein K6E40_12615 [Desulfovibrio sp.]|nr:hypothetical protein [Desulfovibrio sp.]
MPKAVSFQGSAEELPRSPGAGFAVDEGRFSTHVSKRTAKPGALLGFAAACGKKLLEILGSFVGRVFSTHR